MLGRQGFQLIVIFGLISTINARWSMCEGHWSECSKTCGGGHQHPLKYKCRRCPCELNCDTSRPCNTQCCPGTCKWSDWGSWGSCSRSCGGGTQTRSRSERQCGRSCSGSSIDSRSCNSQCCPVHCRWSSWYSWGSCSRTCGSGTQTRSRSKTTPSCGGKGCYGSSVGSRYCSNQCCPVNCVWNSWHSWESCSSSCGVGTQTRSRSQTARSCGGNYCYGSSVESMSCIKQCCPVNCNWLPWCTWGQCSRSCGGGNQTRSRSKTTPSCGGKVCLGNSSEFRSCSNDCCRTDCKWNRWSTWGPCSRSCGSGTRTKTRSHTTPSCGGISCSGKSARTRSCNTQCCPVDCTLSNWGTWGPCSRSCGGGTRTKTRSHTTPSCGGRNCSGNSARTRSCNTQCCPVNCEWSSWGSWGPCSVKCGGGSRSRVRRFVIAPTCGGTKCIGSSDESEMCNEQCCPINCLWEEWSMWSYCSKSCGSGSQTRSRDVYIQSFCGGTECEGKKQESRLCNDHCCPVDCTWGSWSDWDSCSKTCEDGRQNTNKFEGVRDDCATSACTGEADDPDDCIKFCCPDECRRSIWTKGSSCSRKCGIGLQERKRTIAVETACNGKQCKGIKVESKKCYTDCCPVNCLLSQWGAWSQCSATCGTSGSQTRRRNIERVPECGGRQCNGSLQQKRSCNFICFNGGEIANHRCNCQNGWKGDCCEQERTPPG